MADDRIAEITSGPEHNALAAEIRAALYRHRALSPVESLAVLAQMVGIMIALMDGGRWSTEMLSAVASRNITEGATAQLLRRAERRSHAH